MELKSVTDKAKKFVYKYRYAAMVLLIGILLMCIPGKKEESNQIVPETVQQANSLDEELGEILSNIDGAGDVQVLLTIASGEETVYQTDDTISDSETSKSMQYHTIKVTDSDRNELGLVRQINPAIYQGAIVVCQGANDPQVKLAIVNAVSKATGLGTDRISVLKMK